MNLIVKLFVAILSLFAYANSQPALPKFNSSRIVSVPGPIINTEYGPVQGREEFYGTKSVYTYKGIRYAAAPVANLRFRQAIPPTPWTQVFQANNHGNWCPQIDMNTLEYAGNEDCLFINIATPTTRHSNHAVVVNFHGGGLHSGAGDIDPLRADYVNENDVIYVTPNYRLNIFGFFSTGDRNAPGNYGIKDMIMALRWVRSNIANFGGDPNNVSIMGVSGGGVAVHALVVSRAAQGLFNRALSHSGSLFNSYAFTSNPAVSVNKTISKLRLTVSSNVDLLFQLRHLPAEALVRVTEDDHSAMPRLFNEFTFMPSIDPLDSDEPIIFTNSVKNLITSGNINRVPYMVGFNSMESLYSITDMFVDSSFLNQFNSNPHLLIPTEWNLVPNSNNANEVIAAFRNLYFGGSTQITTAHFWGWTQYVSDREFNFGVTKSTRLHWNQQSLYHFRFSYTGALSLGQTLWNLRDFPEAMHGDDAFYFFRMENFPLAVPENDPALIVQQRFVRLWTNYFKFGNPTAIQDNLVTVNWPLYGSNGNFMDIGLNLRTDVRPISERMDIWYNFDQRFNPN
ncbi:juvenile hormone esterase-like [Chironomus tepperi]|uniref:juvenile hormone esterase-like n=1 Tax=Chironomus tepperi TaxID=113505 RepID=UPI00391F9D56